jgi:hypothetical protein
LRRRGLETGFLGARSYVFRETGEMTDATRKAAERQRKREAGLVPVELWVPADRVEELRQIAQEMREEKVADTA